MLMTCADWQGRLQNYYLEHGHWPQETDPLWDDRPPGCPDPPVPADGNDTEDPEIP